MATMVGASKALLKDELAQLNGNIENLFSEIKNADEGTQEYGQFFKGFSDFRARVIMFNRNLGILDSWGDETWDKIQRLKLEFNEWRSRFTDRGHQSNVSPLSPVSAPSTGLLSVVPWWVWGGLGFMGVWLMWPEKKRSHHKIED